MLQTTKFTEVFLSRHFDLSLKPFAYTSSPKADWENTGVQAVEEKGDAAHPGQFYLATKVLSERAAWDFVEKGKKDGSVNFDLVVVNPGWVSDIHLYDFTYRINPDGTPGISQVWGVSPSVFPGHRIVAHS